MKINQIKILNLLGLKCPIPIMQLKNKIRTMKKKEKLIVLSDDIYSKREIMLFCNCMGHNIIQITYKKKIIKYYIERQ
ncbi:sulfurtransferase TusA [Buchnera aphidicola (Thelaxes californica)]|uniref:Sulfurtransferase TusA n=1 Tax=Buchnera aphidicola (Thelaxes californica) TaxID=1315998 RepID=A0A4D6YA27_9GAMM|nr:sulfurtransferase TusA family protein [Buchnera aphidicola]QCI26866.1 sulfurtransferase TusA [Buchnera aphidicola (Thelaxes californica)]